MPAALVFMGSCASALSGIHCYSQQGPALRMGFPDGGDKVQNHSCILSSDLAKDVFEGSALELHANEIEVAMDVPLQLFYNIW